MHFLQKNIDISQYSNFKTPARAEYFFELEDESHVERLKEIYDYAEEEWLKILIIGGGTNMLFAFDEYKWIVIKNSLWWWTYDKSTQTLESYSNEHIREIAQSLELDYGQNLWHRFIGLPGSIWWALFWNAWCFGLEIENNFLEVEALDLKSWEKKTLKKQDMNFSYRSSRLKEEDGQWFIIKIKFDLSKKIEKYHSDVDNIDFRENKQPKWNSCGSFFKNPNREQSAGALIEAVWLKWFQYWGAFFSEKHANFLMHEGAGKWQDLVYLIELAQKKVKEEFQLDLVNEVRIIRN